MLGVDKRKRVKQRTATRASERSEDLRAQARPLFPDLVYTASSDSKMPAEEHTKQLHQELEEAHAELALFTPSKGEGAVKIESHDRVCGCGSGRLSGGSEPEGMPTRNIFGMSSSFEADNSEHGKTPVPMFARACHPWPTVDWWHKEIEVPTLTVGTSECRLIVGRLLTPSRFVPKGSFLGRSFSSSSCFHTQSFYQVANSRGTL